MSETAVCPGRDCAATSAEDATDTVDSAARCMRRQICGSANDLRGEHRSSADQGGIPVCAAVAGQNGQAAGAGEACEGVGAKLARRVDSKRAVS